IDGNKPVGFDKKKLECFKCHNTGHFARECPSKGTNDGKKRDSFYLKNQGTWKLSQLKKLKFEEIKEEFEKLVKQIDTFVPINIEATKAQLKRYGEEL
ncbi:ribonuclease H-like domain-containing protein, partial [Tanacetum coccineum]